MSFCYYCSYRCHFQFIVNTLFITFLTGLVNSHFPQDPLPPGFDCSRYQQTLDRCQPSEKSPESDLKEEVATRGFKTINLCSLLADQARTLNLNRSENHAIPKATMCRVPGASNSYREVSIPCMSSNNKGT